MSDIAAEPYLTDLVLGQMMKDVSLKGYILEEVLARLIKNAGYDLIGEAAGRDHLYEAGNGLLVQGRGAWHQVDVLGQFRWTPPFSFPIRLFLEAKFKRNPVGVDQVRHAIGVLSDINQRVSPVLPIPSRGRFIAVASYRYSYALVSASGFTVEASTLALAHQISLIDLSAPDYRQLKAAISRLASSLAEEWVDDEAGGIKEVRDYLRGLFGTAPIGASGTRASSGLFQSRRSAVAVDALLDRVNEIGELFVATADGPFLLLLKEVTRNVFLRYALANPKHRVVIHWSGQLEPDQIWSIVPTGGHRYELQFHLPPSVAEWILSQDRTVREAALSAKRNFFSRISIFRPNENGASDIFQLEYDARRLERLLAPRGDS